MPPDVFQVLAEPRRREMLSLVIDHELTTGEIVERFEVTRQAVSHHLQILLQAGLIQERREGTRRWYTARPEGLDDVRAVLEAMWPSRSGGSRWLPRTSTLRGGEMSSATEPLRHEARTQVMLAIACLARSSISSGETSSTCVASCHSWPNGSEILP